MKILYNKISEKQFLISSIICCFLGDLLYFSFVYYKLSDLKLIKSLLKLEATLIGNDEILALPHFFEEFSELTLKIVLSVMAFFILFNMTIYYFYFRNKKMANEYVLFLSWGASIFSLAFCALFIKPDPLFGILFLIQALLYGFVAFGYKFKKRPLPI